MPLRIEANAEPIPGYRLIERIGSGGFGEVWKAEAPGGLFKAIKFVQREGHAEDSIAIGGCEPDRSRADQEWKSLVRVKSVRHPFILLLDRFENIDNFLVIVMELADRTLADRFKECRSQGLPGIPRDELLNYLAEAAEVLDLMNSQYQLQHLDIKPQNLFLVHNHVKVADFGLVKDTTSGVKLMTITGGVTPVYAAPETFDGKFTRQCDQYSLAIVYQEMLTGHRPFTGTSMKQLILQHLQNAHDLTPSPVFDRPIIARALSKNPEDRFATCIELVQCLRQASMKSGSGAEPTSNRGPAPSEKPFHSVSKTLAARGESGPIKPADPNFSVAAAFLRDDAKASPSEENAEGPAAEAVNRTAHTVDHNRRRKTKPIRSSADASPGIVQPALVIGIGQLGVNTLTQLRQRIATELGSSSALRHIRMLALDTDADSLHQATTGASRSDLRTQETLLTRLQRPSHYLKTRDGKVTTDSWLNTRLLHRIPREQTSAGLRPLGRLAFVDNYRLIAKRIEGELLTLGSQDTPHNSDSAFDLGLRSTCPRVYIVTSLSGNTGGGMFVDVAYLVRKLLNDQGHEHGEIVGLFYLPTARRDGLSAAPLANCYAALTELQYYCQPNAVFSAHYETAASTAKGERVRTVGPAYQRCIMLPLPELQGKLSGVDNSPAISRAGDFLYRDLATVLGQAIDEQRLGKTALSASNRADAGLLLQSIGMSRILWPRHALLEECSRRLCSQLVARWMSKDAASMADTIRQWTQERWESLGLRPEGLIERFQILVEQALNQKPESMLAEILNLMHKLVSAASAESAKAKTPVNMVPVVEAMESLDRMLGIPEESRSAKQTHCDPAMIERALGDIAHQIADECEQKLAELAVTLLEDPNYRLAGAEEALRQFCTTVEQALKSQETLAKELTDNAAQLHQRIQMLIESCVQSKAATSTQWTLNLKRSSVPGPSAADICELVRTYAKTRYHSLVLTHLNSLYLGLRGHLSDQIREVGFCRARLSELQGMLQPAASPAKKYAAVCERALFPPGCLDLREAIEQLSKTITPDDLLQFDERVQVWISMHCQALLQVCMGSSTIVKTLAPAMLLDAEAFLGERLQGESVAEMYLTRKRSEFDETADDMIFDDLQRCLDEATPDIGRISENNEVSIVTLPNDDHGKQLQTLLNQRSRDVKILLTDRQDEMTFYHEILNFQWKDLEQFGPIAAEAYQQRSAADPSTLHTREDVFELQALAQTQN